MDNETVILQSYGCTYDDIFDEDCILSGREFYGGEIINGRIVISDPLPFPLKYVRAIKLDVVAVIITPTDLSNYGFVKIRCFPDMWARWQIIA